MMPLFGRLLERRATSWQHVWGADLDSEASPFRDTAVTRDGALGLSAVFACVRLLSDTISTLPLRVYERDGATRTAIDPQPEWIDRPVPRDPSITKAVHVAQVVSSMLLDGNAFVLVMPSVYDPQELRVLDPRTVTMDRGADSSVIYRVRGAGGMVEEFDWANVIHVPLLRLAGELRGLSPLEAERRAFGSAIEAETLASRFLRSGTWLSAVLEMPENAVVSETAAKAIIDGIEAKWSGTRNSGRVGLLTGGAKLHQLSVTPEQAQFLETRQYDDERIFRIFRCPPALVGMTKEGSVSYASAVMQADAFEKHTVRPMLDQIEAAYRVLAGPGRYLRFNTAALLRADLMTRYQAHAIGLQNKFLEVDEVRAMEDRDPFGGPAGGLLETPNNNAPGSPSAPEPAARSMPPEEDDVRALTINVNQPDVADALAEMRSSAEQAREFADAMLKRAESAERFMAEMADRSPVVNIENRVEAPQVNVEAPTVNVAAAEVRVPPAVVNYTPPALPQSIAITSMPARVHEVERDRLNRIDRSVERDAEV